MRTHALLAVAILASILLASNAHAFCFGTIHVHVFNDTNRNGVLDAGEGPIAGVVVQEDQLGDGTVEDTLTTDANGDVDFFAPAVVNYQIRIVAPAGIVQTSVTPPAFPIVCNGVTNVSFGLIQAIPAMSPMLLALMVIALMTIAVTAMRR
ncbi:MAG TPA: SdrD B-like domain-containing protein [Thermoanaerobaculia bacterium]|nr:SdrD B-like domain-containing protein [Thermoanaerobaculia bacterium]